jgi:acetyltransferase
VVRQGGAVPVVGFEEWIDALMGFSMLPAALGDRMAIISGPGGLAVSAAEACGREGLKLAELTAESKSKLARFVPATGTSLKNPIDVGLNASFQIDIYKEAARTAAADPGVDGIVMVGAGLSPETNEAYTKAIIQVRNEFQIPFVMVNIPGFDPDLARRFCERSIPFFDTADRAMKTYARMRNYQIWKENHQ